MPPSPLKIGLNLFLDVKVAYLFIVGFTLELLPGDALVQALLHLLLHQHIIGFSIIVNSSSVTGVVLEVVSTFIVTH